MKILITGAQGQLGRHLQELLAQKTSASLLATDRDELDITDYRAVDEAVSGFKPQFIFNCAAYNAVDKAEDQIREAFAINALGPWNLARAAKESGAKFVHVSTDFVFADGHKKTPYTETDAPEPTGAYALSKRAGEILVQEVGGKYFIVRTAWLYGDEGNNFPATMLAHAQAGGALAVVNDQFGSPTYAKDLAEALWKLVQATSYGLYHGVNTGAVSWYDFARAVLQEAGVTVAISPISTAQAQKRGWKAPRPSYSVLKNTRLDKSKIYQFRPWKEALKEWARNRTIKNKPSSKL